MSICLRVWNILFFRIPRAKEYEPSPSTAYPSPPTNCHLRWASFFASLSLVFPSVKCKLASTSTRQGCCEIQVMRVKRWHAHWQALDRGRLCLQTGHWTPNENSGSEYGLWRQTAWVQNQAALPPSVWPR